MYLDWSLISRILLFIFVSNEHNHLFFFDYELLGFVYMLDLLVCSNFLEARFKHLPCHSGLLTVKMVKVDTNAYGAILSRVRVIFSTPHSVSSPEAISDRGWTWLIGVTDQEVVSVVVLCLTVVGLAVVGSRWSYKVGKDPHSHPKLQSFEVHCGVF